MFKKSSVSIAKRRLKHLVTSDRVSCLPESHDIISRELYNVLSRYISIPKDNFNIEINRNNILIHFTGEE